jgi:hypothetical protein
MKFIWKNEFKFILKNELKFIQKNELKFIQKNELKFILKMNWNWSELKWIDTKLHSADLRTKNEGIISDKFLNDILEFE